MASNPSLRSILENDKLKGPNYDSWYHKFKIVLEHERILYVISDPAPEVLAQNAHQVVKDAYQKWLNDRVTVRYIMLASMSDELSRRFESAQPGEILQALDDSFGTPDDVERYKASYAIFNTRMKEGASVMDHVLYMIELIEKLSKLGFSLHEQLGKDAVLNSLPPSYLPFLNHFRMSKPAVNYHGLLELLQTYETDNQLQKSSINLVGGFSSHSRPFRKEKKNKRKKKQLVPRAGG